MGLPSISTVSNSLEYFVHHQILRKIYNILCSCRYIPSEPKSLDVVELVDGAFEVDVSAGMSLRSGDSVTFVVPVTDWIVDASYQSLSD